MTKIKFGNKMITLVDRDAKAAKKMILHFLKTSRAAAEEQNATTFYYTLLVMMNVISTEYINTLTPEVMATILNAAAETERERTNTNAQSNN